jgi:tetratricopeptide (TPR) repeat protein
MRRELETLMGGVLAESRLAAEKAALDERTREALRGLGYVSAAGPVDEGERGVAAEMAVDGFDPKDLVDVSMSGRDVQNGFLESAERKALRFMATVDRPEDRPEVAPLWSLALQNLAAVRMERGDFRGTVESYRESLRHEPGNEASRWGLVYALNLHGRPREAEREGARLLRDTPGEWILRFHRAMSLELLGRREDAARELRIIGEESPREDVAHVAGLYLEKMGTSEWQSYLDVYLHRAGAQVPHW